MKSLRGQLLLYLMAALLISSTAVIYATYHNAKDEIDEMFDDNLAQIAGTVKADFSSYPFSSSALAEHPEATQVTSESDFVLQIWDVSGQLKYTSHPHIGLPLQTKKEWSTVIFQGSQWRVYNEQMGKAYIQVSQLLPERNATIREVVGSIIVPQLVFIPILGLLMWVAVGRTLRPIGWVSSLIAERGPSTLAPIESYVIPLEIKPLMMELNRLLGRLSEALAKQREFIADAAHELRTPLTALSLQINLVESAKTEIDRLQAIATYKKGIERSVHLVHQLLTLARMEPEAHEKVIQPVSLIALVNACVSQFITLAEDKKIDLGLKYIEECVVQGDFDSLRILLSNLIDNAIRYTPLEGKIDISIAYRDGNAAIELEDSGPGIAPEHHVRVFDRFYRAVSGTQGTGLGLSIVKAIADKHNITISLGKGMLGGLKVMLRFPNHADAVN